MRLFIAITLSDEMKKDLTGLMHACKQKGIKGSYAPTGNLPMALAFIGETGQTAQIKAVMDSLQFSPFRLSLTDLGRFGDLIWIGAKGNQAMKGLVRNLRAGLDGAGIGYDKKEFKPHITLIRRAAGNLSKDIRVPKSGMMVKKISLLKSENKGGKMIYTEIYSVKG